jgi:hypothetical protein
METLRPKTRRTTSHLAYQFAFTAIVGVAIGIIVAGSVRIYGMTSDDAGGMTASQPVRMAVVEPAKRGDTVKGEVPGHRPPSVPQMLVTRGTAASAVERRGAREPGQGPSGPDAARQTTGLSTPLISATGPKAAAGDPSGDRGVGSHERPRSMEQKTPAMSMPQEETCTRDAAHLAYLRINQGRDEVIRFERELGCEKLRPQVIRLRESVDPNR